ncbi:MAG TPA: GNAT family N-acetyltransferase [Pyrinomonadaceae bacterium]|nr:GNAT family N-acetyltransferase [Pyrinomonadaceae bacterium]
MNIRLAEKTDVDALVEFNQAMALETEKKLLDVLQLHAGVSAVLEDDQKGFYVVADDSGVIAGGLLVTFEWSDWRNSWFWWIQSVYVPPAYRGQSIYTKLYGHVKRLAGARGNVCGFRLYVEKENERAQRVYEKLGMKETYYLMYEEQK